MEKRSCYRKTHSLPFPFLFSLSKRWHHGCSSIVLSRVEGSVSPCHPSCHLERQSRGLLAEADSPASVLRTFARNDIATPSDLPPGMTEKAKTVGKRNSFPGFSFFECPSFALFLFLSCGDADVSSAIGLVILFWFVFLFIFAYE